MYIYICMYVCMSVCVCMCVCMHRYLYVYMAQHSNPPPPEVAIPFEGALDYVQTPESSVSDGTSFLRKILLVLSHAECA